MGRRGTALGIAKQPSAAGVQLRVHMKSSDRALLISRRQVIDLATPWDYLVAMERAFLELAHGGCTLPPVGHIACREGGFHIKAALGNAVAPRAVVKINGNFPGNAARHGLPTIQGFIALLDAERGTVLAFIESSEITARRTAATTALAARLLAREDSETLGIVGCGRQASCHVQALLDVVNIRTVKFCEPHDEPARQFRLFLDGTSVVGTRTADGASAARDCAAKSRLRARPRCENGCENPWRNASPARMVGQNHNPAPPRRNRDARVCQSSPCRSGSHFWSRDRRCR